MTKDEALRQALEALENAHAITPEQYDEAIAAIKAALAQPERQPRQDSDDLLQQCRGSVKADLTRYEKMLLAQQTTRTYSDELEIEADRLQALLDSIDGAAHGIGGEK